MYYSDDLVEEVRSRADIVDIIGSYVRLTRRGSNYFGLCPFHSEKTGSFSVTPSKQMFYCFGCHEGGSVITFLQKIENYTFAEAVKVLADREGIELPDNYTQEERVKESRRATLLEIMKETGKYYYYQLRSPKGKQAYEYLTKRGLSEDTIKKFGLGYADGSNKVALYEYLKSKGYKDDQINECGLTAFSEKYGMSDKFRYRAMFPIMDANHRIIAFGGRVMGDGEPKYLNSPETELFSKRKNLYGLNIAKSTKAHNIIVCEGYMDAITLHQAGFDQTVATLGTAMTSIHASMLARYARDNTARSGVTRYKDVMLSFDSDGAGVDAAKRAIYELRKIGLTPRVVDLKPYKDPDELIKAEGAQGYQKRLDEAENGFMFEARMLESSYEIDDPTGKSKFLSEVAVNILQFEDTVERESYITKIAGHYNVSEDSIRELVKKHAIKGTGIKQPVEVKPTHDHKKNAQDGIRKTEATLLNWLSEAPEIYPVVAKYIEPDDFDEGIYRSIATQLFEQLERGELVPAKIISMFSDEEEQRQVAQVFHQGMEYIENLSEREAALRDLIIKVKEVSISNIGKNDNVETDEITVMIEQRRRLEELKKIVISLSGT